MCNDGISVSFINFLSNLSENVSYDLKLDIEISKQSFRSEKAITKNSSGPRSSQISTCGTYTTDSGSPSSEDQIT